MREIKTLLEQSERKIARGSSASPTEAGRNRGKSTRRAAADGAAECRRAGRDSGGRSAAGERDQVDAVNQMFAEFELAYHNQYRKAFPDKASLGRTKKYWLGHLRCFSAAQIKRAAAELIASSEFMPTLADIVKTCRKDIALFGLPPARRAWEEACLAPAPKLAHAWSHEAVCLAGGAVGWALLANEPESVSWPLFEYHYLDLCRQVVEGAELKIERPAPLPERTRTELSAAELRERLRAMREELGL